MGLVGVNGTGKTSVLALLSGELKPTRGRVRTGRTVALASLTQGLDELDASARVLATVEDIRRRMRVEGGELTASSLLERFGFTGDRLTARVADLSGGERRRFQLLRLLIGEPNVLLLDEPTNDLDIETLTVLEDYLDRWPGTLVVVSHDRYFLERVCDTIWAIVAGSVVLLPGGVDEYLARRHNDSSAQPPLKRDESPQTNRSGALRDARKTVARLDRRLARLHEHEAELHEQLVAHATDYERLGELDGRLREVLAQRDRLETEWLEAAALLDE